MGAARGGAALPSPVAKRSTKKGYRKPTADMRVVVLKGKELFLRQEGTQALRDALKERCGDVETLTFDGQTAQAADVLDECRSFGLMVTHKLVIVDNADEFLKEGTRELVQRYAESPSDSATLLLRADKWNRGNLDKAIEQVGAVIDCDEVDADTAFGWIGRRAQGRYGVSIAPDAARALIDRLGVGLQRLDTELAKLAVAAPEGRITLDQVNELTGRSREEDMWSIQSELLVGDPTQALTHLRRILDGSSKDVSVPVTYAAVDLAKKLHAVCRGLADGAALPDIKSAHRLQWGSDAIIGVARRMSPAAARDLLAAALEADARQKSGGGDPEVILESLALRFADATAPTPARR